MSYANPRIKDLNMTVPEIFMAMTGGNPGAASVLMRLLQESERIDPDNMLGGLGSVLQLDTMDIYDSNIWGLFKDICQQDMVRFVTILRGNQLGLISEKAVF